MRVAGGRSASREPRWYMVDGMNRARRREIWAEALVATLRAVLARDRGQFPDPGVRSAIQDLIYGMHAAMDQETDSDKRDELYERHRALSATIQELDRQVKKKEQAKAPGA